MLKGGPVGVSDCTQPDSQALTETMPKPTTSPTRTSQFSKSVRGLSVACAFGAMAALAQASPVLQGLYLLDGNGANAAGAGPALTAPGAAVSFVTGLSGQAASFDGSGRSWLRANINSSGNTNPSFSWGAWVKLADPNAWNIFLSNDNGGWDRFTQANGGRWSVSHNGVVRSGAASTDEWTLISQTFDGITQSLYVNGVLAMTVADSPNASQSFIDIGRNANGAYPLRGLMDSVFFFDDTLSAQQMATINAGGAKGSGVLAVAGLGGTVPEPSSLMLVGIAGLLLLRSQAQRDRRQQEVSAAS